jgi:hypothetical protein
MLQEPDRQLNMFHGHIGEINFVYEMNSFCELVGEKMSKFARLCVCARKWCVRARKETDTIRKISYGR